MVTGGNSSGVAEVWRRYDRPHNKELEKMTGAPDLQTNHTTCSTGTYNTTTPAETTNKTTGGKK